MVRPATRALVEDAHRYSASYRSGFANHLPMALVALDAMGASETEIARFTRAYETKLEPIGAEEAARVRALEERLARDGLEKVFAAHAPALAAGIGTAAFHGAIRLAYALESGSEAETAHALAYWLETLTPLPELAVPIGDESAAQVLAAMSQDAVQGGRRPPGQSIAVRMRSAVTHASFARYVARLHPSFLHVDSLAEALIQAYAATGDFTLLHGVTGCHAFGKLVHLFPNQLHAMCCLWTAMAAGYVASGSPPIDRYRLEGDDTHPWNEIHRLAGGCDDEHDVKLAYTCWREWQRSGDDLYRRAASARVSRAAVAESAG